MTVIERAAEVIYNYQFGLTTPSMCRGIAEALHDAGLLAKDEDEAAI